MVNWNLESPAVVEHWPDISLVEFLGREVGEVVAVAELKIDLRTAECVLSFLVAEDILRQYISERDIRGERQIVSVKRDPLRCGGRRSASGTWARAVDDDSAAAIRPAAF